MTERRRESSTGEAAGSLRAEPLPRGGSLLRQPFAEHVAAHLRSELQRGKWQGKLPGYRKLCEELGVGRPSLTAALKLLAGEGLLRQAPGGREAFEIIPQKEPAGRQHRMVRILSPRHLWELAADDHRFLWLLQRHVAGTWDYAFHWSPLYGRERPEKLLNKLMEQSPAQRWIIFAATAAMGRWGAKPPAGTELLYFGGDVRGCAVRNISFSLIKSSVMMLRQLFEAGHRRICIPWASASEESREATVRGVSEEFKAWGAPFNPDYNMPVFANLEPEGVMASLTSLFQITPPGALVLHRMEWYLSLVSFCGLRGMSIPKHVSAVVLENEPFAEYLSPLPVRMDSIAKELANAAVAWIKDPACLPAGLNHVEQSILPGETIRVLTTER